MNLTQPDPSLRAAPPIDDCLLSSAGAGFGDPETNALVEKAAVDFVTAKFSGWHVEDVSEENLGYDLRCSRGSETRHVEVTGVKGGQEEFIITRNELQTSETDPDFVLAVVTRARTEVPSLREYSGPAMREHFGFTPIAFRAQIQSTAEPGSD